MSGTEVFIGRHRTTPDLDIAEIGPGQQLAYIADTTSETIIVYRLGFWGGKDTGNPSSRVGIAYMAGSIGNGTERPGDLIAYTDPLIPTAVMVDIAGGQSLEDDISPVTLPPANYGIAVTSINGTTGISMRAASGISGQSEKFFRRSGLGSTVPTNPVEGSSSNEGHLVAWATGEVNVKPNNPTNLTPSGTTPSATLTPTFSARFSDPNEILNNGVAWDRPDRVQFQVFRTSDGYTFWNLERATTDQEKASKVTSNVYSGLALVYNTSYRFLVRHQDRSGAWSNWTEVSFTLQSLAGMTAPSTPSGLVTTIPPSTITSVYSNGAGLNANRFQARLLASNGTVLNTGSEIVQSAAPGATVSLAWNLGSLSLGTTYGVQVRARDTNNQWGQWSTAGWFRVNTAPNVPTNLNPANSVATSTRPLLTLSASDVDPEHAGSAVTVFAEIMNASNVVLQTRTMTYNATTRMYQYQTVSGDIASFATYKWRAYSYDGSRYSGGSTTAAGAARSGTATFVYAAGPTVTRTAPVATISTTTPIVSWTVSFTGGGTKQSHRVQLYRPSDGALVYDSGTIVSATNSHTLDPAKWIGEQWNNGETFNLVITVTDSNGLAGTTSAFAVTLSYTPPETLSLDGTPIALPGTSGTNAVILNWTQSQAGPGTFEPYQVWRTQLSGAGEPVPGTRILLRSIANNVVTVMLDAEVTSNTLYRWELIHRNRMGFDVVDSVAAQWTGKVSFTGLILHMPFDPEGHCVHLQVAPAGDVYQPSIEASQALRLDNPLGSGGGRVAFFGKGTAVDPNVTVAATKDLTGSAEDKIERFWRIYYAQNGDEDGQPHIVCWRDGRGGRHGRLYGVLVNPSQQHAMMGQYNLSLSLRQVAFTLGEST